MLKAIIFDLDGVIINSEYYWSLVEFDLLRSLVPSWDKEKHQTIIGKSVSDVYSSLRKNYPINLSCDEFMKVYDKIACDLYATKVEICDGCLEFALDAKKRGLKLGISSSSPRKWIDLVVNRFKLNELFDVIVSSDDIPGSSKPSPDLYIHTVRKLGVVNNESIAIEDSKNGIIAAKAAGIYCVAFNNGYNNHPDLALADLVINKFNELKVKFFTKPL
ncbi:HAD family phosphatase [Candidatus Woesearchaeota archaeon]|nr:HAD family phosphatase [Candidatus Woesearchaeota archaeon]